MIRTDKENYYLDIAETVSERGTCLRRNFGAIIVQNDEIVATGYNGAPRGRKNCIDTAFASGKRSASRVGNAMKSAAPSMQRQMRSSAPHGGK